MIPSGATERITFTNNTNENKCIVYPDPYTGQMIELTVFANHKTIISRSGRVSEELIQ